MSEYKQCIIIRDDLKLSKGKLAVQVAHAAVSAMQWADRDAIEKWKRGGQKKVVLRVATLKEMFELREEARRKNLPVALIQDAGLTQVEPGTVTVLGIGPADAEVLDRVTGHLKLV
ncbi:Aminoacyl-tRNA hydrolase [Methanosalsum zhilinae DSM 4017]|uniref:Peptidyl-tRNA hydrolase n=1 Tax=Methanosalsum zhilinae (strain DSM 4017 / NBRC 107636 / OCM 62 / WeN5) TaxID=679901 RepID=F7XPJ4_METZD|nr:peptidyl-tRNA hydrolase Pth2 [Methanosalsum zhilinae]AEH61419.1 Aminoacyl-tRNA hydrolase [Methanosalsum zhilinae DSM 4017]